MDYQCRRSTFTEEQYSRNTSRFCPIPIDWGRLPGPTKLAQLRQAGGFGALSIYPLLGQYTHTSFADYVRLSKEEMARLSGRDVGTVRRGAHALTRLGLVTASQGRYRCQPISQWAIQPQMAARRNSQRLEEYFYFSSQLLHGGAWSRLTAVQQALFLAVGTNGFSLYEAPDESFRLHDILAPSVPLDDLHRCYEANRGRITSGPHAGEPLIRMATLSYAQLAEILTTSPSALKRAVKQLKHPEVWPESLNDRDALQYSPLAVYPTNQGTLLYHIRDHAPHWPWAILNASRNSNG